jgi:hypothetical protein
VASYLLIFGHPHPQIKLSMVMIEARIADVRKREGSHLGGLLGAEARWQRCGLDKSGGWSQDLGIRC